MLEPEKIDVLKKLGRDLEIPENEVDELIDEADHIRTARREMLAKVREEKGANFAVMVNVVSHLLASLVSVEGLVNLGSKGQAAPEKDLIRRLGDSVRELAMEVAADLDAHFELTDDDTTEVQALSLALVTRMQELALETSDKIRARKEKKAA